MSNTVANCRENEVLVEMRVMLEDLVLFHGLKANSDTIFSAADLLVAAKKHDAFLLKHFTVRDARGRLLKGVVDRLALRVENAVLQRDGDARFDHFRLRKLVRLALAVAGGDEHRSGRARRLVLVHDAEPAGDFLIGFDEPAHVATEAVLVELVLRRDIPQPARIRRNLVGNDDAPKSLVIVPWKSSDPGDTLEFSRALDEGRRPVDRDVFQRELDYYRIRSGAE